MIQIDEKFHITNFTRNALDRIFDKTFTFAGESHDFWEVVYVVSGNIEVVEEENIYILREGDIIFHAPMEFHKICAAENTAPHVLNISFTTEGTLPPNLTDGVFHLDTEQQLNYRNLFDFLKNNLIETERPAPFIAQEAACRLALFILHLCNTKQVQEVLSGAASALTYKSLVSLMRSETNANLSIAQLSEKSFISISYIKFLFKHYAGISPKTYYNNLRITEAKRLLDFGHSVTETANKMNFSSPNNFIRFFKTQTSITPYQYKKI